MTTNENKDKPWPPAGIDWYYSDGSTAIALGDCRDILPHLEPVDLVLTDPPYGKGISMLRNIGESRGKSKMNNYQVSTWDLERPASETFKSLVLAGNKAMFWGGNYFADMLPAMDSWLVWDKKCQNGWKDNFADCEMAWTNLGGPARVFRHLWMGACRISETESGAGKQHPTQKPIELMKWCLELAPSAGTILDPFMGSGTTLRAAKDLGRKCIGIEIEEKYCEIAVRRLQQEVLPL